MLLPLPPLQPMKLKVPSKNSLSTVVRLIAHVLSCLNRNAESFCANFMCSEVAVSFYCQAIRAFGNVVFCGFDFGGFRRYRLSMKVNWLRDVKDSYAGNARQGSTMGRGIPMAPVTRTEPFGQNSRQVRLEGRPLYRVATSSSLFASWP